MQAWILPPFNSMRLKQTWKPLLLCMSLLAPQAWGESEGLSGWQNRLRAECASHFGRKLESWQGIAWANRNRIAQALCSDDRVFWPFAAEIQPQLAPLLEGEYNKSGHDRPLIIGIIGASTRENSEALHAIRDLLFPSSNTLLRWTGNNRAMEMWRSSMEGGLLGGVVMVDFEDSSDGTRLQVMRMKAALSYMQQNQMDSYVLAVQSRTDVRDKFANNPDIKWISFDANPSCASYLR